MTLSSRSLEINAAPHELLSKLWESTTELLWLPNWGGRSDSVLALNPIAILESATQFSKDALQAFCTEHMPQQLNAALPWGPLAGGVFGALSYEASFDLDRLRSIQNRSLGVPRARFGFYPVVIVYSEITRTWSLSGQLERFPAYAQQLQATFQAACALPNSIHSIAHTAKFHPQVSEKEYSSWVRTARKLIQNGDIYQANLAHPIRIHGTEPLVQLFERIHTSNPSPWACIYKAPQFTILSNSPELLLTLKASQIVSKPIAGTRPRGSDTQSDEKLRRNLLRSPKERAEHLMLVDLVRNDLGKVCTAGTVSVPLLMDREPYRNVYHIVSTITGTLNPSSHPLDALEALFPGGTITGTPKLRSIEIIDSLESHPRGFYTGSLGYINPCGDLEFNILIRTLQVFSQTEGWDAVLHVGAGIVADSVPRREYHETLHKADAWKQVLAECVRSQDVLEATH